MKWQEIVAEPSLQDLPYKIETNEWGQIMMTPAKIIHGKYQLKIGMLLTELVTQPGEATIECAIQTLQGTKVADVVWVSTERWQRMKDEFESDIAPEICIEVVSPGNSGEQMKQKCLLYFAAGAQEVWTCDKKGNIRFFTRTGEVNQSSLAPQFPKKVKV